MSARQYSLVFLATLLVLAAAVAAFNRAVDPFWYYRDFVHDGFNAIKPKFKNYERHVKPAIVEREQPASLVFGSSFAEVGFDPLHPALRAAGTSYNFGLAGAQWDMVQCDVAFALARDSGLRQIILGIHPQSMPLRDCQAEIDRMSHPEEREFLFSYDALEASLHTVLEQQPRSATHTVDGRYFYTRGVPGTAHRFGEFFALHTPCDIKQVSANPAAVALPEPAALDLSGLRNILRRAAAKGITVKLVVYPRHALSFEQEYQCGVRQERWDALTQIAAMAEQEAPGLAQVWDFEGYHDIGTEPISEAAGRYWQDPAHFNSEFGNLMLDEMFGLKPPAAGICLTQANVAARAQAERTARDAYLGAHPAFLQQLADLLPRHGR